VAALAVVALAAAGSFRRGPAVPTAEARRGDLERWVSADGVLRAVESTPLTVSLEAPGRLRIAWIAPEGSYLEAGETAVRFDPSEVERTLADRRADLESNDLKLGKQAAEAGARLATLERQARIARSELEHAREFASRDELIHSRVEIVESQIDQELAGERLEQARQGREREASLTAADRELLGIERRKLAADLDRAERALEAMAVRAPHPGYLVYQRDWRGNPPRVGDTVFRGFPLAEIPRLGPGQGTLEVEAFVLEADAGGLSAGDRARVHLEARAGAVYEAEVAKVEAVAKPRHPASPVQYFAVTLSLAASDPEWMKPGQRVRAEILMEDLPGVLTVPRQAVFERRGGKVVYRFAGGAFAPVEVTTGAAGRGRVVVAGPLEAGDRIALQDPTGAGEPGPAGGEGAGAGDAPALPARPGGAR
jgi:multidrug efflux pump subunit AcrA (membrane-fusion protein)